MRWAGRLCARRPPLSIRLRICWLRQCLTEADLCPVAELAAILPPPHSADSRTGFASRFEMYQVPRLPARLSTLRPNLDLSQWRFRPFPPNATERASPSRRVSAFGRPGAALLLALSLQGHCVGMVFGAKEASFHSQTSYSLPCSTDPRWDGAKATNRISGILGLAPSPLLVFHSPRRKSKGPQISEQSIRRRRLRLEPAATRGSRHSID